MGPDKPSAFAAVLEVAVARLKRNQQLISDWRKFETKNRVKKETESFLF